MLVLDHLVVAAPSLQEGAARLEPLLGAPLEPGGRHEGFGTCNRLLSLGPDAYLELIAPDPERPEPALPRPFGLDGAEVRARLERGEEGPPLLHWVARAAAPGALERALAAVPELGEAVAMTRGDLAWRIAFRGDRSLLEGGLVPTPIDWGGTPRPPSRLPDRGVRVARLRAEHPEPAALEALLDRLGARGALRVEPGPRPRLVAALRTPHGEVELPTR